MVKKYTRCCDECGKQIENLYNFGVTTLYRRVRIGRGSSFKDYAEGSIHNEVNEKTPDDYDNYGTGWKQDKDDEFSFCTPKCFGKFMLNLYENTYSESIENMKGTQKEFNKNVELYEKKYGQEIPFFRKIQTKFSKQHFLMNLREEIKTAKERLSYWDKKVNQEDKTKCETKNNALEPKEEVSNE